MARRELGASGRRSAGARRPRRRWQGAGVRRRRHLRDNCGAPRQNQKSCLWAWRTAFPPHTGSHTFERLSGQYGFRDTPDSSRCAATRRRTSSATCTGRRVCGFVTSYRNDLPHIYCASQQSARSLTMLMQSTATRATPPCEPSRLRVHLVHHHKSPYANWQRAAPCVRTVCKRILCVGATPTTCFCKQGCCVKPTVKPSLSKAALSGGRRVLRQRARPALRPAEVASEARCSLGHDIRKSLAAHAYWGEYVANCERKIRFCPAAAAPFETLSPQAEGMRSAYGKRCED